MNKKITDHKKTDSVAAGPLVSIVIPLFNKAELTRQCYDSIIKHTPDTDYEIIFVDNGSTDGTQKFLKNIEDNVKIIINEENLGFSRACNIGAGASDGQYILFLNNDVKVMDNWLTPLIDILDNDRKVAAAGSKLLFPDGAIQHAGVMIVDDQEQSDPLEGKHIYYRLESDFKEANQRRTYQALTAACLLIRKSSFEKVKGFDEGYWNGYEDVDLCFKLREQGWILVYEPESVAVHYETQSGPERFSRYGENVKRLHKKWLGKISPDFVFDEKGNPKDNHAGAISLYSSPERNNLLPDKNERSATLVSIIILAYNQLDYTKKCIESIFKHTEFSFELILVDNGSTDDTWAYMESLRESKGTIIRLIRNRENLGFAGGNNQGIAVSSGEYVLLLNNDTLVTEGWLKRMIACAKARPGSGIIGPMSNHVSGPQLVEKVNYNVRTGGGLNKFSRKFSAKHKGKAKKILRVVGFCMLIKQEVIKKIGGLDERFGKGNFEDDDFSIRAALAGFESWVAEDCFIHHFGSKTFSGIKIDYSASLENNWKIFKKKWGLPDSLPAGSGYAIPRGAFDSFNPENYYIPIPEPSSLMDTGLNKLPSSAADNSGFSGGSSPDSVESDSNAYNVRRIIDETILLASKGFADRAVKILLKAIKTIKDNKDIIYCLADILLNEKQYAQALKILNTLPEENNTIKFLEIKAFCEEALGHDIDAGMTADRILSGKTVSPAALYIKGKLAIKNSMVSQANEYFTKATETDPAFGPAWSYLGLIKKNNGSALEAFDLMEKGFSLSPDSKDTLTFYYNESLIQKQFDRAERVFKDASNTHPEHKLIYFRIIDLLLRQEKYDEAMELIQKAIVTYGLDDGIIAAARSIKNKAHKKNSPDLKKKNGTLSACMIVKNEEHNIGKCLLNLKGLADEIIVVDTGSSDRTRVLAEIYGAKTCDFEWNNDFSAARNFSLSKATGSWILLIDADEIISPADHNSLRSLIKKNSSKSKAFLLTSRNYQWRTNVLGINRNHGTYKEEAGYGWVPSTKVRLFRNRSEIRLEYHVHEMVEPSLKRNKIKIERCSVPVHHYGKLDYSFDLEKGEEYYKLGIEKLRHSPDNAKAIHELAIQAGGLDKHEEAVELWEKYIKICPEDPVAYINMGTAYLKLKNLDMAVRVTKKAMELAPELSAPVSNYGNLHMCMGQAEVSVPVFEKLKEKYPDLYSEYFYLASAYACTRQMEKASLVLEELKDTVIAWNLPKICRNMVNQLISFKQYEYAKLIVGMLENFLVGMSLKKHSPDMSSAETQQVYKSWSA